MPVNAGPEFFAAEKKYSEAKTKKQKIAALEEMIKKSPKHKGTEKMLRDLRKRLKKLKSEIKKEQAVRSKSKPKFTISKEGAAQICIFGLTNSGKSTLLKALTNANVKIASYSFTTKKPAFGMMDYTGVKIQMVEIPSTFTPDVLAVVRTCDLILILLDCTKNLEKQLDKLVGILEENNIIDRKMLTVANKSDKKSTSENILQISAKQGDNFKELKDAIWPRLDLMRVYTKSPNSKKAEVPLTVKKGATVRSVTKEVHKTMLKNFRFARIFNKTKYSGRKVGMDYVLYDLDVVEIHAG